MRYTEHKTFLIASTQLHVPAVKEWLGFLGGLKVLDTMQGAPPEQLVELAARRCYKSFDVGLNPNITKVRTDSEEYHANILAQRHGSVLAHATCTFAIEDASRIFTHEHVRNSIGNAFSQESLRYVRLNDIPIWIPTVIANDPEAMSRIVLHVRDAEYLQTWLAEHFKIDSLPFAAKKQLTSAFRRFAPMGVSTGIVTTFNMRSLRWSIDQRTEQSAEEEIRIVFDQIAEISVKQWPFLFQDFTPMKLSDGTTQWKPDYSKV